MAACVSLWDDRQLGLRKAQVPGRTDLGLDTQRGEKHPEGRGDLGVQAEQTWSGGRCAARGLVSPGGLSAGLPVPGEEARSGSREGEEQSRESTCSRQRVRKGWAAWWVKRPKKAVG